MNVFKENLHQLLLQAPMKNKVVLGFDPGYAHGCKIAIIDRTGKVLDTTVIYPTEPRKEIEKSSLILSRLIKKYNVDLIALGNGTASRESEKFIRDFEFENGIYLDPVKQIEYEEELEDEYEM